MINIYDDTPELRARIEAHNAEAAALHLPPAPVLWIHTKVESSDGRIVHERNEKANSWTRNMFNALFTSLVQAFPSGTYGAGALAFKDTAGVNKSSTTSFTAMSANANDKRGTLGSAAGGIVVGSGTNVESFENTSLQTLIANGTGAGQLSYQAGTEGTPAYDAETKKWTQTWSRIFNNNTGSTITVNETGLYWGMSVNGAGCVCCLERSKLSSGVDVPAAYKLTVTYTAEMTMPA